MAQLTVFNPDDSIADILFIPECLDNELKRIARIFNLKEFNLAFFKEIKRRVLSRTAKESKWTDIEAIQKLAVYSLDWFGSLLDVIVMIEQLPNPEFLTIRLSE